MSDMPRGERDLREAAANGDKGAQRELGRAEELDQVERPTRGVFEDIAWDAEGGPQNLD